MFQKVLMIQLVGILVIYLQVSVEAGRGRLLWSDEFNDFSSIGNNWNQETGGGGWGNNELQYYTALNARTENGDLIIETRREQFGNNRFTSSRLLSKQSFKYGVFEMRAKLPKGRGTWPAFWLLAANRPLSWPLDGEIDVMEHVGYDPNVVHGTIHCNKYNHMIGTQKGNSIRVNNVFDEYHTYTLEWSSTKIEVSLDGVKYFTYTKEDNNYNSWPFDNNFNIILNTAVGGDWGGVQGVDETIFPVQYKIDYVRQYEYVPDAAATVVSVRKAQIRAVANNKFVSATNNGLGALIASQVAAGNAETFEITQFSDGFVALKSMANNRYVCADNYGNSPLIANRDSIDDWELFQLVTNSDGTFSFRGKFNWQFVCADNYGNDPLIANRATASGWESFYIFYL